MNKLVAFTLTTLAFAVAAHSAETAAPAAPAEPAKAAAPAEPAQPAVEKPTEAPKTAAAPKGTEVKQDVAAAPEAKPKGKYEGMFTFDWKRLTKCQYIGPIVNAKLENPKNVCKKMEKETGEPARCKISEQSEYLIFSTMADCKVEYEEQLRASPEKK